MKTKTYIILANHTRTGSLRILGSYKVEFDPIPGLHALIEGRGYSDETELYALVVEEDMEPILMRIEVKPRFVVDLRMD